METLLGVSMLINFLCFGFVKCQNYNVLNFGAKGDGETDDSTAFSQAWNASCSGEGDIKTLVIPAGNIFLLQPIEFKGPCKSSSIKVQLDGVITAPSNREAWSNPKSQTWISFSTVSGLVVAGSGKINGRGSSFWELKLKASERPAALHIVNCNNISINGITSIDSPRSHISIKSCNTGAISNINLFAPEKSPNTDGIDISDSTNINIFDSIIQTGDDCIAIGSGSSNINITKINCGPGHGISVGSLGAGGTEAVVSDVQVTQCTFNQTMNGARIKTFVGGHGYARNISYENITLINTINSIIIDQQYIDKGKPVDEKSAVAISNIRYVDFRGITSNEDAITLKCSEVTHCKDIVMDGFNITTVDGAKPKVDCEYVEGESNDPDLMRDCFKNTTLVFK